MEIRGNNAGRQSSGRAVISRRSCDQCRARKGSPCSNCVNARVDCTHSVVASRTTEPKQRVLISAQYEKKIDDIAEAVDDIKLLLRDLKFSSAPKQTKSTLCSSWNNAAGAPSAAGTQCSGAEQDESPLRDHSVHFSRFVRDIVECRSSINLGLESNDALISLRCFTRPRDDSNVLRDLSFLAVENEQSKTDSGMPPLNDAVQVLRWAKDHPDYYKVSWLAKILPHKTFNEVCQNVYFAVDGYTEAEFLVANGYLYWLFSEYFIISGSELHRFHAIQCRRNLHTALSRFPLLSSASMETIAALTIGALYAIENSKATLAWTFSSAASNHCQTLGYQRLFSQSKKDDSLIAARSQLFWTVYGIDKSLSLRLGRASNIQESEITLPPSLSESLCTKNSRIQGKVYDQLFSPFGLSRPQNERSILAEAFAVEVREVIKQSNDAELSSMVDSTAYEGDKMRGVYIRIEKLIRYSLLALLLQVASTRRGCLSCPSENCVAVAHDALVLHEECTSILHRNESFMMTNYTGWTILHTPFVPFIILFCYSIHCSNENELSRLEKFTESLQPATSPSDSAAGLYQLFRVLCQVARLYIRSNASSNTMNQASVDSTDYLSMLDLASFGVETSFEGDGVYGLHSQHQRLGELFYENQQTMGILDEDLMS